MKTSVYIAVAAVAAATGFLIYRYGVAPHVPSDAPSPATTQQVAQQPAAAPAAESDALPEMLPEFTLGDLSGAQRSIRSWPGKSMIVNFWATWCAPCRREIPLLRELQKQHGEEGFQVVGVAVDFRDDVIKYAQDIGIDYPVLIGEQDGLDAVNKFGQGALGFPFTVFTASDGRIVLFHLGEIKKDQVDVLLGAVRKVNSGELTPAAARVVAAKQLAALPSAAAEG